MKKISLIRHGETDWNVEQRIQGHTDIPLNATGMRQAQQRAKTLQHEPFDACFSSDLSRAHQTAQALIEGRSIPLHLDTRLRERRHGPLEGLRVHEYHAIDAEQRKRLVESPEAVVERLFSFFDEVSHSNILIVTHGGVMKALLYRLMPSCEQVFVGNTALLQLIWQESNVSILHHDGITLTSNQTSQ